MDDITSLVRQNIKSLIPYRSARDDYDSGILLDANENSYGAPFKDAEGLNRYPDPFQKKLRSLIADYRGVNVEQVFVGVGSDEAIDLLVRIFCEPGRDHIIILPPTYGMYRLAAELNNVGIRKVLLNNDFQPVPEIILEKVDQNSKILFLCSPNNPTGNALNREAMLYLAGQFRGIVVVDEAYIDFTEMESLAETVSEYPNLVVTQTLSKAFGLAGIRLGIAIANPAVMQFMMKIKAPYNINTLTSRMACKAFEHLDTVKKNIKKIIEQRKWLAEQLRSVKEVRTVFPSDTNFLLFRIDNALEKYKKLAGKGVITRYRGNEPLCEDCLRVTVGTPEQNKRFITLLETV